MGLGKSVEILKNFPLDVIIIVTNPNYNGWGILLFLWWLYVIYEVQSSMLFTLFMSEAVGFFRTTINNPNKNA